MNLTHQSAFEEARSELQDAILVAVSRLEKVHSDLSKMTMKELQLEHFSIAYGLGVTNEQLDGIGPAFYECASCFRAAISGVRMAIEQDSEKNLESAVYWAGMALREAEIAQKKFGLGS